MWGDEGNEAELALLSHCRDLRRDDLVVEGPPSTGGSRRDQQRATTRKKQGSGGLMEGGKAKLASRFKVDFRV